MLIDQCKNCGLTVRYSHPGDREEDADWCVRGTLCADRKTCDWMPSGGETIVDFVIGATCDT